MKILIAAGGSGGHIFPATSLARALKKERSAIEIRFVGSNKALDKRIFEKEGFKFWLLSANSLPYRPSWRLAVFFLKLFFDMIKAVSIVASYRPCVMVGFGGYVSCPVVLASFIFRIPIIMHEQNVTAGRANALLFKLAGRIAVSFEETLRSLSPKELRKAALTGNPIRSDIFRYDREAGIKRIGLNKSKFTILVIGGSQGAHFLNETFIKALGLIDNNIKSSLQVIHITGIKDYEWALGEYKSLNIEHVVNSFIDRIEEAYSASDLVVTRSGASAVFELAFFGRPMILVPYPFAMSHQAENARAFADKGAAIVIDESALNPEVFKMKLLDLFKDRNKLNSLSRAAKRLSKPDASRNLAKEVLALGER